MNEWEPVQNLHAWTHGPYEAWVRRFGTPSEAAARIRRNPTTLLYPLLDCFGDVSGKNIVNIMGSNGVKALALSCLGATVTVIDWSADNARYARELAAEAGAEIEYLVLDVTRMPEAEIQARFDIAFAELGIVHYFTNLGPLMQTACRLLVKDGRFILRDFHPVSTKLITSRGTTAKIRKHKVTGDYFDTSLEEQDAPYTKHLIADDIPHAPRKVLLRRWTIGEVVTAVGGSGLHIRVLREEPNLSCDGYDRGIPKTYTLVADKMSPISP